MTKMMRITDFLSQRQIVEAARLLEAHKTQAAREICEKIIRPNLKSINKKLGQENDPMYLAYAVEYVLTESKKRGN